MGWIQDIYKVNLEKIKSKFQEIDSLFRGTDAIALDDTPRRVKSFEDVMIHGNSLVLERVDGNNEVGYYILDSTKDNARVGVLAKAQVVNSTTTMYSLMELYSDGPIVQSGEVNDLSTTVLVRKENAVEGNSAGMVIAIANELGEKITEDIPFFVVSNGYDDTENLFSIHTNYINMPKQGVNYSGTLTAEYVGYLSQDGKFFTGESLSGLTTTDKTIVGAINELAASINSSLSFNVTPYGKFDIQQSSSALPDTNTLQKNDIASGWISSTLWVHGCFIGSGDINIPNDPFNYNHWEIFTEYEKQTTAFVIGSATIGTATIT